MLTFDPLLDVVDLDGPLPRQVEFSGLSGFDLESLAGRLSELSEGCSFTGCSVALEYARRAGPKRTDRAKALRECAGALRKPYRQVRKMLEVGRYFTPERQSLFPTLTFEHCLEIVLHTKRKDETEAERLGRIARAAREAADADLTPSKAGAFAASLDCPELPEDEQVPLPEPDPEPAAQVAETFLSGLRARFLREAPGTFTDMERIAREFVAERVAQGWRLEAPSEPVH